MRAGTIAPPNAARIGRMAFLKLESSPLRNSRLISSPTTKKKIAMSPSSIQAFRVSWILKFPILNPTLV